jgi:hypothetical protein
MKVYLVDHMTLSSGGYEKLTNIVDDINKIKPDKILALCLEEYDYSYIFKSFFEDIQPYLKETNISLNVIAPFVNLNKVLPDNIVVEPSYGYYHWSTGVINSAIESQYEFVFENDTRLFTNYNNNSKYQRAMLIDELSRQDLIKDGIVTLIQPKMFFPNSDISYEYLYYNGLPLYDESDFKLNSSEKYIAGKFPKSYLKGYVDVVSESTYDLGEFFITEKTAKPIGALKPFLVFGPPNVHKYLYENYGIEYYDELFDYSFDSETSIELRIQGIVNNLLVLRQLGIDHLKIIHDKIKQKLLQNRINYLSIIDSDSFYPKTLRELKNTEVEFFGDVNSSIMKLGLFK